MPFSSQSLHSMRKVTFFCASLTLLISLMVIAGWHFNISILMTFLPGYVTMKFNTALCLILFSSAQVCILFREIQSTKKIAFTLNILAFSMASVTLFQYITGTNLGVDEFFYKDLAEVGKFYPPGRMAPITALSFLIFAFATHVAFFAKRPRYRMAQVSYVITSLLSFQALVAYLLGIDSSFGMAIHSRIAVHTALSIIFLCVGYLFLTRSRGYMPMILSQSLAGLVTRRLLLITIVAPPLFGFFEKTWERYGLFDRDFGILVRVIGGMIFFIFIVWKIAEKIQQIERSRRRVHRRLQENEMRSLQLSSEKTVASAIQKSEARLRAIFDSAFSAIISTRFDGSIIEWNPTAEVIFGWEKDEVIGKKFINIVAPSTLYQDYKEKFKKIVRTLRPNSPAHPFEITGIRRNGESFIMRMAVCAVDLYGDIIYTVFIEDISESKRAEADLIEARQRALTASQIKSDFLANMSHEIRTPLNGIIGMLKLLSKTDLNRVQTDFVKTIELSSNILLTLINQILDLAKVESGKLELNEINFNLKNLLQSTIPIIEVSAQTKGLALSYELDENADGFYLGDSFRIQQILINLMNNAVKFSEKGTINLKVRKIFQNQESRRLHFEIEDQGIGIDTLTKEKLFQAFSQGENSRGLGGTGLGLVICKQLVELMGGQIRVESIKGIGSKFSFDISLKFGKESLTKDTAFNDETAFLKIEDHVKAHILVAEDNKVNQRVISEMLELMGCTCTIVETGHEALEALKKEFFHLVLMDGQMPQMDGYEATKCIRQGAAGEENRSIPIIAVTASAIVGELQKSYAVGMDDITTKPILFDDLTYKLKKWVARGRQVMDPLAIQSIESIASANKKKLLEELVLLFHKETPPVLSQLKSQIEKNELLGAAKTAHLLKSSCANLGLSRMQALSERIEKFRSDAKTDLLLELVHSLDIEYTISTQALQSYLDSKAKNP